jgi:diguanylate cyclase
LPLPLRLPAGPLRLRRHFLTIVLCLLLGTGMAALVITRERDRLVAEYGARLAATAGLLAERLDQGLNAWARDVLLLARFAAFKQAPADPVALRRLLEDLRGRAPEFAWMGLAATDGHIVAATGGVLEGRSVADRSWFAGGLRGLYVGEVNSAVLLSRLSPDVSGGSPQPSSAPPRRCSARTDATSACWPRS